MTTATDTPAPSPDKDRAMSVARTAQQQPPRATYQDVLDAPAHLVAEIINGTLYTHPRPAMPHARATWVLGGKIGDPFDYGPRGPGGWWLSSEPELHLDDEIVVPDLAGWRRERMPDYPGTAYVTLAPDWVCEVHFPVHPQGRPAGEAAPLRPGRRAPPVARRPRGPHPRGVRAPRRGMGTDCDGEERRSGEYPPVRRDHLQPRRPVALIRAGGSLQNDHSVNFPDAPKARRGRDRRRERPWEDR